MDAARGGNGDGDGGDGGGGDDDDGGAVASGVDFATVAENGRLREVIGLLEPA